MPEKCLVKIVSNRVVCDNASIGKGVEKAEDDSRIKNKAKFQHLVDIGMDLKNYHPTIIRTMIDGGRNFKVPENIKHQLTLFAKEAQDKGFNPSLFGYNTTLHKMIKRVHNIPKRKYVKKGKGVVKVAEKEASSSSTSSVESETDLDAVLSEVESDLENNRISAVKRKIKKYKHKIPPAYYQTIMQSIK
jgi:hypothetical protein